MQARSIYTAIGPLQQLLLFGTTLDQGYLPRYIELLLFISLYISFYICQKICKSVYVYTYMYIYTCIYTYKYVYIYIRIYTHIYIYICVHEYAYTHIHFCMCICHGADQRSNSSLHAGSTYGLCYISTSSNYVHIVVISMNVPWTFAPKLFISATT